MSKYNDVIFELAYDKQIQNNIESVDDELKDIFNKFNGIFIDMYDHHWQDDSKMYGDITFAQFKRIYMILLSQVKCKQDSHSLNLPLPCQIGQPVWEIYADDCGNVPCMYNCEECKDAYWKRRTVPFNLDHISKYNKTIFLTESEAERICERNKELNKIRHQIKMNKENG